MKSRLFSVSLIIVAFGAAFFPFGDRNLFDMHNTMLFGDQFTQITRNIAEQHIREGNIQERAGNLVPALYSYQEAFLMDDPDSEIPDLRGQAGVLFALCQVKLDKKDEAIKTLQSVLKIRNCPDSTKSLARDTLSKLGVKE
jgi:hypothetical protein